jgi:hypothetical protein
VETRHDRARTATKIVRQPDQFGLPRSALAAGHCRTVDRFRVMMSRPPLACLRQLSVVLAGSAKRGWVRLSWRPCGAQCRKQHDRAVSALHKRLPEAYVGPSECRAMLGKGPLSDAAGGAQFSRHITNYHEEVAVMRSFLG